MSNPSHVDPSSPLRILVVADDLIWASRIVAAVQRAGAVAVRLDSDAAVDMALEATQVDDGSTIDDVDEEAPPRLIGAVVDLFGHRYDGVAAVRAVHAAGLPVVAVAQHDDLETRKLALDSGATRVFSYNKFFQDGPAIVTRWLVAEGPADPDEA